MSDIEQIRTRFIENLSGISEFWGYPRAMGALYGALYLSPTPLSLDDLCKAVSVTKGSVSTNIRMLEQLGMVVKQVRAGDRKDYYEADTDFWQITRTVLLRRQKPEFDKAIRDIGLALSQARKEPAKGPDAELAQFYAMRLEAMESFFKTIDGFVAMVLQMEKFRAEGLKLLMPRSSRKARR